MLSKKKKLIIGTLLSLMITGCSNKAPDIKVADSLNASKFSYNEESEITLIRGERVATLTNYVLEEEGGEYLFSADILTNIFSFTKEDDFEGYQRYVDKENNTLLVGDNKDYILLNNEPIGLLGKVIIKDGKYYLPKDFFMALPGVCGMENRRDGDNLIIKLS